VRRLVAGPGVYICNECIELSATIVAEAGRLQQVGLDRFAEFVTDWDPEEVQMLTALLEKLERPKAAVAEREARPARRRRRGDGAL
jgi:ATP-dependent protease Clp ATPase subunit